MTFPVRLLFFLCLFTAGATPIMAREAIVPATHYPPWRTTDQGQFAGIDFLLINTLLQKIGYAPRYVERPWKRCLFMMETGDADLMNGLLKRKEREQYMLFLEPPYRATSSKAFYVRKGSGVSINDYADLQGKRIGTCLGAKYFPRFDNDSTLRKDQVKEVFINVRRLATGRIDCFLASEIAADYIIASNGYEAQIEKARFSCMEKTAVYFAISKKSPLTALAPKLSAALQEMVDTGEVDKIIREYIKSQHPPQQTP